MKPKKLMNYTWVGGSGGRGAGGKGFKGSINEDTLDFFLTFNLNIPTKTQKRLPPVIYVYSSRNLLTKFTSDPLDIELLCI